MANNTATTSDNSSADGKMGITQEQIFENVNKSFEKAGEVIILEASNSFDGSIPMDTRNSINDALTYPTFAQDDQRYDEMLISFTYTEEGFMKILSLNSSDEELKPYITSKLENIRLEDGSVTIGKAYDAKIQFQLL